MTNADDLANVTSCKFPENPYCQYEKERLSHLMIRLESSLSLCGRFNLNEAELKLLAKAMIPIKLTDIIDTAKALRGNFPSEAHQVQPKYDALLEKCHSLLEGIAELKFPPVKPRWADFTDAGPGVACNNFEVQFKDDYRIRLHSSRGNSSDNEAERTNSAIGDSIVDGATLQWNKHKRFDGLSDEDISKLTVKEFEEHETDRMEKNACCTAAESKQQVPGYHYITNVLNFIERHYRIGELYMEYIRDGCRENGEDSDIYIYKAGTISSDNVEQLKEVSSRYCVEEKDVASYVKHLEELKMMSAIRENERRKKREKECSKTYENYDWNTLIDSGKLNSLKVMELDKYLKRHDLSTIGKKEDKIKRIKADFYINRTNDAAIDAETSDDDTLSGDGESDSDDDEVLQIIPEGDEDDNSTEGMSEDSDEEIANLPTIRSRRAASFPHARYCTKTIMFIN
ncbi:Transient receptor potential cation channel subfamily A member 1 [Paramuricea clavata]|uniref:Transient receptor potential cation channel subfamily A member 1 n=1 Tax=Paramuricea clavata TaxID=317549 RepID=A0A6S7IP87_PARCT|nr:Transient receptor potential cation channel subfamily A member 1 [Paramuricea clavata]